MDSESFSVKEPPPMGTNSKGLPAPGFVQEEPEGHMRAQGVEEDTPVSDGSSACTTASVFATHDSITSQFLDKILC